MAVVTHGELIAVGVAVGRENTVEVDDKRAVALEDALVLGIGKNRGQGGAQLPVRHTTLTQEIDIHEVLLSLCIEEVGHGQGEVLAPHRGVVEDNRLPLLCRLILLQQGSEAVAQPLLIVEGDDGQGDGDADEKRGIGVA